MSAGVSGHRLRQTIYLLFGNPLRRSDAGLHSPNRDPKFRLVREVSDVGPLEPVISVVIGGDTRAYPIRILLWHAIVNDIIGGVSVLVSYCLLCNSGVVFDRCLGDRAPVFDNTGWVRHYDVVMYDRTRRAGGSNFWARQSWASSAAGA